MRFSFPTPPSCRVYGRTRVWISYSRPPSNWPRTQSPRNPIPSRSTNLNWTSCWNVVSLRHVVRRSPSPPWRHRCLLPYATRSALGTKTPSSASTVVRWGSSDSVASQWRTKWDWRPFSPAVAAELVSRATLSGDLEEETPMDQVVKYFCLSIPHSPPGEVLLRGETERIRSLLPLWWWWCCCWCLGDGGAAGRRFGASFLAPAAAAPFRRYEDRESSLESELESDRDEELKGKQKPSIPPPRRLLLLLLLTHLELL